MTPSRRIFQKLAPQLESCEVIDWIAPVSATSISEYAVELVAEFGIDASCDLVGVSFGGMVAQEVARLLGTSLCFVVSSAGSSPEYRLTQRLLACLPQGGDQAILRTIGAVAERWPRSSSSMGTVRARKFQGKNGDWFRWATAAALRWRPVPYGQVGVVRIHGDRDRTFPHAVQYADIVISGAGHMLALTHSSELATAILQRQEAEQVETQQPRIRDVLRSPTATANKTDTGNGSKAICRVSDVFRSPSPDPGRYPNEF